VVADSGITVHQVGSTHVVRLPDAVDASSLTSLNGTMARLIDVDRACVVVDVTGTTQMDSRMIGALAGWHKHADRFGRGRVVFAVGDGSSGAGTLFCTLMHELVPLHATVDEAVAQFNGVRARRHAPDTQ
jgi:anti-anti-sigma regulatory factor